MRGWFTSDLTWGLLGILFFVLGLMWERINGGESKAAAMIPATLICFAAAAILLAIRRNR